jgi:hypothetical protein
MVTSSDTGAREKLLRSAARRAERQRLLRFGRVAFAGGRAVVERVRSSGRAASSIATTDLERAAEHETAAVLDQARRDIRALGALTIGAAHHVEDAAGDQREAPGTEQ